LQFNGLAMSDFETTAEAFKTADDLIVDNKAEYGHTGEPRLHKNPLICKYLYVKGEGEKRTWEQAEHKEFSGSADPKTRKQLQEAGAFIEGMGLEAPSEASSSVKLEFVAHSKLLQAKDSCKSVWK
jgi:hypothetical protein